MTPALELHVVTRLVVESRRRFGKAYRSTYLWGGHARGDAIETSDLDVGVFVRGTMTAEERALAATGIEAVVDDRTLDLAIVGDEDFDGRYAVSLHCAARRADGEDLRDAVPLPSRDEWVDLSDEAALWWVCRSRPRPFDPSVCPFDEADEFLGYLRRAEGSHVAVTKRPLSTAGRIATARVARASGRLVGDRPQAIRAYGEDVGDAWAPFLVELQERLRSSWRYQVPTASADRETLRRLCERTLAFEQDFIARLAPEQRGPRTDKLWNDIGAPAAPHAMP